MGFDRNLHNGKNGLYIKNLEHVVGGKVEQIFEY
jgi:hypothetical protein